MRRTNKLRSTNRRRTLKGGFAQFLNMAKGLGGKLGSLKGLKNKFSGIGSKISSMQGKIANTQKFLKSKSITNSSMGNAPGGVKSALNQLKGSVSGLKSIIPGLEQLPNTQQAQAEEPVNPQLNTRNARVKYMGQPQAQVVPPPAIPMAQYANTTYQATNPQIPSAPPMAQVVNSRNMVNLQGKYPGIICYYLATDGKYYPANNLRKYGPKQAGGKTRRNRRRY